MSAQITTGKVIAETAKERAQLELRRFERGAIKYQNVLAKMAQDKNTGWLRLNIRMTEGKITTVQIVADEEVSLDGKGGD